MLPAAPGGKWYRTDPAGFPGRLTWHPNRLQSHHNIQWPRMHTTGLPAAGTGEGHTRIFFIEYVEPEALK